MAAFRVTAEKPVAAGDDVELQVELGRVRLRNPILAASGTFGYAREMEQIVDSGALQPAGANGRAKLDA